MKCKPPKFKHKINLVIELIMKKRVRIYKPQGRMPNVQLSKAQDGTEVVADNVIHSRFDPRMAKYKDIVNQNKAAKKKLKEYADSWEYSKTLPTKADSIKYIRSSKHQDIFKDVEDDELFIKNKEGEGITYTPKNKQLYNPNEFNEIDNPYEVSYIDPPWVGEEDAAEESALFRKYVNEVNPSYAKENKISITGPTNNSYLQSAYYDLGEGFEDWKPVEPLPYRPLEQIETSSDERTIIERPIPEQPRQPQQVVMPGVQEEWVESYPGGPKYLKQRAAMGDKRTVGFAQQSGGEALQRFIPRAQAGMQQPGMQQQANPQQQQQQMQQQMMQMIEQALMQGADPRTVYNKLAKQLQGQVDPKMINQMVSMVVDKVKESMIPNPQEDVAAMQGTMLEPQGSGMQMPSQNQMMTDQIMSEEMDESYLMDSAGAPPIAQRGGPVSKRKFISNVLKLAKKQMGGPGDAKGTQKASIRDTAQFDRESIKNDFMIGVKEASTMANIKNQAEQQYDMMMQQQQDQQMQMQAQFGGYVDGNLKKFCGGGIRKAQTGFTGDYNPNMTTEIYGEEEQMVDPNAPGYVGRGRSYHYNPNAFLGNIHRPEGVKEHKTYERTFGDFMYDVFHPNKGPRVKTSFQVGGERRDPIVGETWDTWYTSNGSTPGFAPNNTVWNGSEWVSDYDPDNIDVKDGSVESAEDKEKRIQEQIRRQELSDGVRGYTPEGKPIYPGIFDKRHTGSRRRGFRDLYPFNKAVDYIGSYGEMSNARLNGQPYTGGIDNEDLIRSEVTKSGLFGRPKEWTNYYTEDYIIDPDRPNAPSSPEANNLGNAAVQGAHLGPNSRGRFDRRTWDQMDVEQQRDAIDAGYRTPQQGNVFERMKWKMQQGMQRDPNKGGGNAFQNAMWKLRQGRPEQAQEGGLTQYQVNGEVQLSEDYETPAWHNAFQNIDAPVNLDAPVQPYQYEVNENMGGPGTPFNDEIAVDNKRKDMYNIDFESGVQQFNAAANFGIGLLEKKDQASQQKWLRDQLNADNLYGQTRKRKLGDWDQLGNFRPDQQGFRGVAQSGGQMPTEGAEMYMSEEEIQRFISEGGELEFI
jgi:hypothetical protein